jgi:hypothetical protein
MVYPEPIAIKEIQWEYNCTKEKAQSIVDTYKDKGRYHVLCHLLQIRESLKGCELCTRIQ